MRRNYASLDLAALSAASAEPEDVDLAALDADSAALFADVQGLAEDSDELHAVAHLSLDDPRGSIGCPLEMMADRTAHCSTTTIQDDRPRPRPTSPPSAVPIKMTALPSIRPSATRNDPVRRSIVDFAPSSSPALGSSPYASKSKLMLSSSESATPIMLRAKDYVAAPHAKPLVPLHRNAIQSV